MGFLKRCIKNCEETRKNVNPWPFP